MWDFIINPFVTALTLFYSWTGNIVFSIVVFTIVTRMLTYPMTVQQQRSTKKMQEIQPMLKKLQEKHKNDRDALAKEQMKLYQENGINPASGCVGMFIQLPIFIGLYQAIIFALAATPLQLLDMSGRLLIPGLTAQIPLQNTWIGMDLTLPPTANPIYAMALPLLVVVTTWAQSKLTLPPTPPRAEGEQPDQTVAMQQSMTTMMPLMFGFFSLSFSVGISIYFITSNLIGAFQYGILNRLNSQSKPLAEGQIIEEPVKNQKPTKKEALKAKR